MGVSHVGSYQTAGRRYSYQGGGVVRLMGGWRRKEGEKGGVRKGIDSMTFVDTRGE